LRSSTAIICDSSTQPPRRARMISSKTVLPISIRSCSLTMLKLITSTTLIHRDEPLSEQQSGAQMPVCRQPKEASSRRSYIAVFYEVSSSMIVPYATQIRSL